MTSNFQKLPFILIDDNPLDLKINERLLLYGDLASQVKTFLNARNALDYIRTEKSPPTISVVLLDIQMPEMDGFAFLKAFNKLPELIRRHYFIFMLSSTLDDSDLQKVWMNPDALALLPKPLDFQILKSQLGKLTHS